MVSNLFVLSQDLIQNSALLGIMLQELGRMRWQSPD
jgi:hypothetical protein